MCCIVCVEVHSKKLFYANTLLYSVGKDADSCVMFAVVVQKTMSRRFMMFDVSVSNKPLNDDYTLKHLIKPAKTEG